MTELNKHSNNILRIKYKSQFLSKKQLPKKSNKNKLIIKLAQ